jgi:hypothetical protein
MTSLNTITKSDIGFGERVVLPLSKSKRNQIHAHVPMALTQVGGPDDQCSLY